MSYTTHGHHIKGTGVEGYSGEVARCGGPGVCTKCSLEATENFTNTMAANFFPEVEATSYRSKGTIPVYLPGPKERVEVGRATINGDTISVELNSSEASGLLKRVISKDLLYGLSFTSLPSKPLDEEN